MRSKLILAASALALGLATAGAASAQTYGRIVSFGDSLTDNGNLYAATGGAQPLSPPYYQGRFSNGPTWVELLGFTQARVGGSVTGSINYAYGGARTDLTAMPPGMRNQLAMYQGAGGTFGSSSLVTVWGGANNIFQGLPLAAGNPDPYGYISGVSAAAAADIGLIVNTIAGAGAGTILVPNLPNLAVTPQFAGGPAQGLANQATNVFNAALYSQLTARAAANPNTNIIHMDVYRAFEAVRAAPGRFGFTNVTQPCFNGVTVCSSPDSYAYWDGVHPTAAGQRLIAAVAVDHIYYRDRGAHSALQAEIGVRSRADALDAATGRLGFHEFDGRPGGLFVGLGYEESSLEARGIVPGGDIEGMSFVAGAEGNLGSSLRAGFMFGMRQGDVSVDLVNFDAQSVSFDAYAGWRSGAMFVNASAGVSFDKYEDILRQTAIAGVVNESSTEGQTLGARLEGGVVLPMRGWALIPRAGLSWVSTEVDGYVESGSVTALHQIASRGIDAVSADAILRLEGGLGSGFDVWAEAGYRDVLSHDGDAVSVRLAGNTALPLSFDPGDPDGGQTLIGAGLSTRWGIADVSIGYRGRLGEAYDTHMGGVEITLSF